MRSIDINSIIAKRLANYPDGSVSRRDVVATYLCADERAGWELNGRLTKAIYSYWQQANLHKPLNHLQTKDELTAVAQKVVADLSAGALQKP